MSTNRRILIDNATLSGVERITGISKTLNLNNIDNDILCLEKLVTAILFSDELIGVDDYKSEFRSRRLKNFEFINFSKMDQGVYNTISEDAAAFARNMTFSFDGARPTGDVLRFFEALKIDTQLRWNIWVSSEYLTLSYLVDDTDRAPYERSIDSVFRTEETDRKLVDVGTNHKPVFGVAGHPEITDVKEFVHELSSRNPQFSGIDGKSALDRILFGYGWAAERSFFYNSVANLTNSDVYLAPLRDAFCESCCRIDYPNQITSLIERLKVESQKALSSILDPSGLGRFAVRLPFFTAYLISRTKAPSECIDLAFELRNSSEFQECRTIFHNLAHLSAADRVKEINDILKYLDQSCTNLMKKYAVTTENGLQFSISLGITGINLGANLKIGQLFRSYKNRSFSRVFRNISQDMLNVQGLGGLYDKVCSSIQRHPKANHPQISMSPDYMENRKSEYGRPAKI